MFGTPEPRYEGKSRIGAVIGSLGSAILMRNNSPLVVGLATGGGILLGYGIGSYLDKIDQIHASMVINQSLTTMHKVRQRLGHPNNNFAMSVTPQSTMNQCRKFNTTVQANGTIKVVNGIACRQSNGQWNLREVNNMTKKITAKTQNDGWEEPVKKRFVKDANQ